jgi:hypothetical protein
MPPYTSPHSLSFKPLSLYSFSEQSYRAGRPSISENKYFTIVHLFERNNENKFFVLGTHYRKEMALEGAGFAQR